jgi:alpha-tubulin suppressor-like RCC1 family protein
LQISNIHLAADCVQNIFYYLSEQDQLNAMCVCRLFHEFSYYARLTIPRSIFRDLSLGLDSSILLHPTGQVRIVGKLSPLSTAIPNNIKQVACGMYYVAVLNQQGKIAIYWQNETRFLDANNIIKIAIYCNMLLALNTDGKVIKYKIYLLEDNTQLIIWPTQFTIQEKFIDIAVGDNHILFLSDKHQVFSCGSSAFGALGFKDTGYQQFPTIIPTLANIQIKQIAASNHHSLFLTIDGKVLSCGENTFGQLGRENRDDCDIPTEIINLPTIQYIAAGDRCSLFVANDGTVFCCNEENFIPQQLPKLKNIIKAYAGFLHFMALNKYGEIFGWGKASDGRLGQNISTNPVEPTQSDCGTITLLDFTPPRADLSISTQIQHIITPCV